MRFYLLVDFGSTFTKLTAVDLTNETILATAKAVTTVETDIAEGYHKALGLLYKKIGKEIVFAKKIACSSAAGGLKMVAIGLIEELTTEAAKRVCLGAGAKVEMVFNHHLNQYEIRRIEEKAIDIVLLAGGTDGGNREAVIHNAKALSEANLKVPIVYAGNKDAIDEVTEIFKTHNKKFYVCENVMPRLNILNVNSAKEQIKAIFVENIIDAKGIRKIESTIDKVILPTPNAVLMAAELLANGFDEEKGLGDLMLVDIGGATTDVYSIADGYPKRSNVVMSGLQEPYAKRTVEGDLGMRYSTLGIIDQMTDSEKAHWQKRQIDVALEAQKRRDNVDFLPESAHDFSVEIIFASKCVDAAVSRHVGTLKSVYTPLGMMYNQIGK
ncbi:MAG: methylaspartate mutase accessory protein GlmL, partial [Acholeplasmataceae bacterium]